VTRIGRTPIGPLVLAAGLLVARLVAADPAAVLRELAPTGTLRVAIAVGPAPSGVYALKDDATGTYRGVTIDLAVELARKLGVPIAYVPYRATGEIQASAGSGAWDVTFMPVDDERKKVLDFGSPYHLLQSTYLVAPGSAIQTVADANRPGVRIAGVKDTATFRASSRASPNATHLALTGPAEAIAMMVAGQADAIALSRASLGGVQARIPGSRILDGGFLNSTTAIAVPKDKPAALAYVSELVEEAKASGLVRRGFDAVGLHAEQVAPAGMKP
jgi:polar amino acid transport system substrate-binding protein